MTRSIHKVPRRGRVAVLVATLFIACGLTSCGFTVGEPNNATEGSTMKTTEFSRLDDAGVAQILASKSMRLDFRQGAIPKADVGLPESAYAPDVVAPMGDKFKLSITGGSGTLAAETDHVRFTTTDTNPDLDLIYYFLTTEDLDQYVQLLRDAVTDYGLNADATNRWIDDALKNPEKKSNYSLGNGNKLGFNVGYDLRYDGSKKTQVIIVAVSAAS